MSQHYPGPWKVHIADSGEVWIEETTTPDRLVVADIPGDMESIDSEELANAALIAAAPDLEEAAVFALSVLKEQGLFDLSKRMAADKLEAVLAKARGEEPRTQIRPDDPQREGTP